MFCLSLLTMDIDFQIMILDRVIARLCRTDATSSLSLAKIIIWKSIVNPFMSTIIP